MKHVLTIISFFIIFTVTSQPQYTDSTFGNNGRVVENFSASNLTITDAVLQTDGKSIVLAEADYDLITRVVLIRYNTNGTLDNSFSNNGVADSLIAPDITCYPKAIKLQPDGKILVCGHANDFPDQAFLIRYNVDGTLDNSFATNGVLYLPAITIGNTTTTVSAINNLAVLPNSKILLLSNGYVDTTDLILISLNMNGSIDSSFGTNGALWINAADAYDPVEYFKIKLQTDGKIIVGGNPNKSDDNGYIGLMLIRLHPDGRFDNTFGTNGRFLLNAGPADIDRFTDMILQPDGKIVASGTGLDYLDNYNYLSIVRINTNGILDNTFGTGGKQYIYSNNTNFGSYDAQISLQQDGKILIGGYTFNEAENLTVAAARLTTNGNLDNSFDGDGIAPLQVNTNNSYGMVALQQSDTKVLIAGFARVNDTYGVVIGRLTSTGQIDNTIVADSTITITGTGPFNENGINVHIQADQKILNIRERDNGFATDMFVSRHLPNGSPDNTYGNAGKTFIDMPGYVYDIRSGLLSNGKLMIAAYYNNLISGGRIAFIRINTNGNIDSSFGLNGRKTVNIAGVHLVNTPFQAIIQPDDKVVVLLSQTNTNISKDSAFLLRFNADGNFDSAFNNNGKMFLPDFYSADARVNVQSDGKILLAYYQSQFIYSFVCKRFNQNGSVDNTFNFLDTITPPPGLSNVAQQPNGKILIVSAGGTEVRRLQANGTYDSSFGNAGIVNLFSRFPSFSFSFLTGVLVDSNTGSILLRGVYTDSVTQDEHPQLIRLKSNGYPDSTFGINGGIVILNISGPTNFTGEDNNQVFALQADGKVIIAGYSETDVGGNGTIYSFAITRLKSMSPLAGIVYIFTGSGAWNDPANWSNNTTPPATLPAGSTILIDPVTGGECVFTGTQHISAGGVFIVKSGKKLRIAGGLILQ